MVLGADRFSDLAVVKIDGTKLPVLSLADLRKLSVDETVIAIGNPLCSTRSATRSASPFGATARR